MGRGRPAYSDVLTPREWEVLSLIRDGLTNPQIAQRLGVTDSAAKFHVSQILSKLGVESRQEAADWAPKPWRQWSLAPLLIVAGAVERLRLKMFLRVAGGSAIAVVGGGFLLLAVGVAASSLRAGADPPAAEQAPPVPQLPYERAIMFVQEPLVQYVDKYQTTRKYASPASLLAIIPSAQDAQSLASQITGDTTAIILDKTSLQDLDPQFLKEQLQAGISFIGLNVPISELAAATSFAETIFVEFPGGERRRHTMGDLPMLTQKPPEEPFYSALNLTPLGAPYFRSGMLQKTFNDGLFAADLKRHLQGANADIGVRQ